MHADTEHRRGGPVFLRPMLQPIRIALLGTTLLAAPALRAEETVAFSLYSLKLR